MTPFLYCLFITCGWLLEVFFCYFTDYQTTTSYSGESIKINSYSLAKAVMNGDVPQPAAAAYVIGLLLLAASLIMVIVALVMNHKYRETPRTLSIACFPFPFLALLCAIFGLVSWAKAGSTGVSGHSSYGYATVTLPGVFIWIYISYFLTAATAVVTGVVGLKTELYITVKRRPSVRISPYSASSTYSAGSLSSTNSNTSLTKFERGQKVVFKKDYFSIYGIVKKGEKAEVRAVTNNNVYLHLTNPVGGIYDLNADGSYLCLESEMVGEEKGKETKIDTGDKYQELAQYKKMLDNGLINQEDYDRKKMEILK